MRNPPYIHDSENLVTLPRNAYDVSVFKTNINADEDLGKIERAFSEEIRIQQWSVDRDDIDNVLRIVSTDLTIEDLIKLTHQAGYWCEELPD